MHYNFGKQQEIELQCQEVIDAMIDPIHVVNENLEILFINKAFKKWSSDLQLESDIVGRSLFEVYSFLPDKIQDEYQQVFATQEPLITEETQQIGTQEISTQIQKAPIFSEGKVKWVLTTYRNITEHKKIDNSMREAEERLRLLTEQSILGIAILQDWTLKYVNDALAEILEYSTEELLSWGPDEYGNAVHPEDRSFVFEQARKKQLGEPNVIYHSFYRVITKTGKIKWLENYSKTIIHEGKTADFITLIDITDRREAEEALKESERKYKTLITTMTEGICLIDLNKSIRLVNPALEKITGYSKSEMLDHLFIEFLDSSSIPIFEKKINENFLGVTPSDEYELTFIRKNGTKINTKIAGRAFREGSKITGSFAVISDISTKRELEERRSSFMSMTAHELRTPTTIIRGYIELLESFFNDLGLEDEEKYLVPLQIINKNVHRLERLISDVRDIVYIERGGFQLQKEDIILSDLMDEFLGSYKVMLKDQLESSSMGFTEADIRIEADSDRLLQVLGNLMQNAINHTSKDTRKITVSSKITFNDAIIEISDNGAGIDSQNLERIFELFTSIPTEYSVQGTGVGLFLSRYIAEAHGGSLTAYSKGRNLGSTFKLKIPRLLSKEK
ncbi:MAG: PAS domain S-box protein [Promethearchaeota archaeon]